PAEEELRLSLPELHQQFLAIPEWTSTGEMLVRIRAAATPGRDGRFPRMRVESGITLGDGDAMDTRPLGAVDVTATLDEPAVYEFRTRVEDIPKRDLRLVEDTLDRPSVYDLVQVFISNVSRDERSIYALGPGTYRDPASPPDRVESLLETMAEAGVGFLYLDAIEIEMLPASGVDAWSDWSIDLARAGGEAREQRDIAAESQGASCVGRIAGRSPRPR